jgi:hypothetical protein
MGGFQAVIGSVLALALLISAAQQLNGQEMSDALAEIVKSKQATTLGLTVEGARKLLRYTIMVMAVLSVASLVLGVYVLRRHRASRIALTVLGGVVALLALLAGPAGWAVTLYIGASLFLIWTRPARAWFGDGPRSMPGGPASGRFGPPQGPRRDVDGVLPPPQAPPPQAPSPQSPASGPQPGPTPPPSGNDGSGGTSPSTRAMLDLG